MEKHTKKIGSFLSTGLVLGALVLAPLVGAFTAHADAPTVTVTIAGYLDGSAMTATSAGANDLPMTASWNAANIGAGSGGYSLSAAGYNGNPAPYQAQTVAMSSGANYSTNEVPDGANFGASCVANSATPAYGLVGYSTGDTLADAAAAAPTATLPSFTNMTADEFVIVWNQTCAGVTPPSTISIHVEGYLDGTLATPAAASNYQFPMSETYTASNQNNGSQVTDAFVLGNNTATSSPSQYEYDSVALAAPASYAVSAVTGGTSSVQPIGATCTAGQYSLQGYKTSAVSFADAASQTATATAPSYTGISADQYVLVMDNSCGTQNGTVNGTVTGGSSATGTLAVTSVTPVNATATADGTFADGWKYLFNVTVPDNETHLSMKFSDWANTADSAFTIPVANNVRISSDQADNSDATVTLSGSGVYSSPEINITGDMDPTMPGKQIQVLVETAVPVSTVNGSYTTTYGVQTLAQ